MTAQDRELVEQVDLALRLREARGIRMIDAIDWIRKEVKIHGHEETKRYMEQVINGEIEVRA